MRWTTMTFNLRVNVESDGINAWPHRPAAVAAAINRHDADIVGIQEGLISMLRDLEPLLSEYAWIGEGRKGGENDESCAILYKKSKWRVVEQGSFGLSETPERLGVLGWQADYPRMCTWARLRSAEEESFELALFNTHLDHVSEEAQVNGMELVKSRISLIREGIGLPVVLTGDFNVTPEHPVILGLESDGYRNGYSAFGGRSGQTALSGVGAEETGGSGGNGEISGNGEIGGAGGRGENGAVGCEGDSMGNGAVGRASESAGNGAVGRASESAGIKGIGRTFHDFAGGTEGEPIDYIFATPDVRVESIEVDRDKYEGRYPSDHYPVVAVLQRQ